MTKDVIACILERRSVRNFTGQPIPEATLGRILDAARWAPSAGNLQPWEFYVVLNPLLKEKLAAACNDQETVRKAAANIVVCALPEVSKEKYGERGEKLYCIQDTALAAGYMLLAAAGYGIGSCWIGWFNEGEVQKVLGLPPTHIPTAVVSLGYSAEEPPAPARWSQDKVIHVLN
ncbi:nitroreductase family protein [Zhaonella formicivorans]|jgi:nitroreductase|uniref:nitroreductase family protein n=1 Tax=Zhaonella formicivorans TaxID=2528593 RepID=UPI0010D83291|nr:nitroreductase family protein [Zhaonella formicivorans]